MSAQENLSLVQVFAGTSIQAEMVKSLLADSKIKSFIKDEYMGNMFPFHTAPGAAGSVKVVVSKLDFEKAKLIVEEYHKNINQSK